MKYLFFGAAIAALAACETTEYDPFVSNMRSPERAERTETADLGGGPDGLRCENIQVIGSRTPAKRVCQTEEEWARLRENAQEVARDLERLPIGMPPPGS